MTEELIGDIWCLFKEYTDKKQVEALAESFVAMMSDYGVDDEILKGAIGVDPDLDESLRTYLEIDESEWDD